MSIYASNAHYRIFYMHELVTYALIKNVASLQHSREIQIGLWKQFNKMKWKKNAWKIRGRVENSEVVNKSINILFYGIFPNILMTSINKFGTEETHRIGWKSKDYYLENWTKNLPRVSKGNFFSEFGSFSKLRNVGFD